MHELSTVFIIKTVQELLVDIYSRFPTQEELNNFFGQEVTIDHQTDLRIDFHTAEGIYYYGRYKAITYL